MKNLRIGAMLLGGLFLTPIQAMAQTTNIAYASEPSRAYVVFFDSSTGQLSNTAADTVRSAARAAGSAKTVRVAGRVDHAEAVKNELVRDGVPWPQRPAEPARRDQLLERAATTTGSDEANEGRKSLVRYDEQ